MFPVDLPDVEDLASASERYLSALEAGTLKDQSFRSSNTSQVSITPENIVRLQLFDDDQPACFVLALHSPDDPGQVLALYLQDTWWALDDVLRTSSESRRGVVPVRSMTERLIVFLLSQVVDRRPGGEEAMFSLHPPTESCRLLWSAGRAVGFYSVKHKGSLCGGWHSSISISSYVLPVLDSLQVRSSCRRRGFGLLMLEDFCSSFCPTELLGLSSPLSPSMAQVLQKFLRRRAEQRERLYEVEAPGGWAQRRNIWLGLQLGRYTRAALPNGGGRGGVTALPGGGMEEEEEEEQDEDEDEEDKEEEEEEDEEEEDEDEEEEEEAHRRLQNRPLDVAPPSSGPQAEPDPTRSRRMSGTGSGSAAHAERSHSPSSGPPPALPPPPLPPPGRRRSSEDPEEGVRTAKRTRRT